MIGYYAERTPDAPALRYADEGVMMTMTYSELRAEILKEIDYTRSLGAEAACHGFLIGDGVSPAELVRLFAAVGMGAQVVMLDANTPVPILRGLLPYTDVNAISGDPELCRELEPNLCRTMVQNGAGKVLFFTSGTTERSKAVVLTEKSLCSSAYNGGTLLPLSADDTLLCMLPLHHVFGFVCGLLWGLSCGACVALGRGARHYIDDCDFFQPTAVSVVPMLLGFLLKQNLLNEELKLILVGAGDCPAALLQGARARGIRVSFGYGLTETSSGVALSLGDDPYAMTVCPDDEITIAPDGEILIKVRSCMMKGYYKCPEDTNTVLAGGMLHTGDLGRFDDKGRLHVTGRKKDMLVLSDGTKLFLPEAEAELAKLLGNVDFALALSGDRVTLALYGDTRDDEAVFAAIEPYQGTRPRSQQIAAISRQGEPLPRTATGKVKRWELNTRL